MNIERLITTGESHWSELAGCLGDARFTGGNWLHGAKENGELLVRDDFVEMREVCARCPVFDDCDAWANRERVRDVFAAGYWRYPDGPFTESD